MKIQVSQQKDGFARTTRILKKLMDNRKDIDSLLAKYGELGVKALKEATPKRTGKTAASWYYTIQKTRKGFSIEWHNSNITPTGENIAILIQRGHGVKGGGYVQGRDYIKPALRPIFEQFANEAFEEVTILSER